MEVPALSLRHSPPVRRAAIQVAALALLCAGLEASEENPPEGGLLQEIWSRDALTGDWGGWRSRLKESGIALEFYYTLEVLSNVSGGRRRGTEALGNADLMLTFETEPLTGWRGGKLFLYGLGNHGGDPSDDAGDAQIVSNIEAFDTWKLYEAWFDQQFLDDRISLLVGLYDLNSEFDVIPSAGLFLNSSFGVGGDLGLSGRNGPSIFPTTSLGARIELRPVESIYLRAAVLDGVPGDPEQPRGTRVILREDDGLLLAGEVGFVNNPRLEVRSRHGGRRQEDPIPPPDEGLRAGLFGKYAAGAWGYTTEFDDLTRVDGRGDPERRRGTYGVYMLGEQRIYYEPEDPIQGLALFARAGIADDRVNPVDAYLGGGAVYRGPIPGRNRDRLGVGIAAVRFGDGLRKASRRSGRALDEWEIALEATYRFRISPWFSIQPEFQYVVNPGGDPDQRDAVVVGGRMLISF